MFNRWKRKSASFASNGQTNRNAANTHGTLIEHRNGLYILHGARKIKAYPMFSDKMLANYTILKGKGENFTLLFNVYPVTFLYQNNQRTP